MHDPEIPHTRIKASLPTISDYVNAFMNPYGRFRTLDGVEPQIDARGEVVFFAGNNAAVFPVRTTQGTTTLKCYIKNGLHAREIYSFLAAGQDPLLTPVRRLEEEIFVHGAFGNDGWYDVVATDWVAGVTLETAIRRASRGDGFTFDALSRSFERLAGELLTREWAHGDLKPENIIVRPDGSLCLIDYDAMFIPSLAGRHTLEVGTPPYQHPARDEMLFDKSLDDYAIATIATNLRALVLDPSLYNRYNRSDNKILYPPDILSGQSKAYDEILQLFAQNGEHDSYDLARSLCTPSPRIPGLARKLRHTVAYPTAEHELPKAADVGSTYTAAYPEPYTIGGLWGYRNGAGREVTPAIYTAAHSFSEGVAVVCIHGRWQAIDTAGHVVLDFPGYSVVKPFSEGLAAACSGDGRWGYISREGAAAVEPRYEMAGTFREGLALVRSGGRYGYIDRTGHWAIRPVFDYATGFRNGRAMVECNGGMFEIGPDGEKM